MMQLGLVKSGYNFHGLLNLTNKNFIECGSGTT